MVVEVHLFLLFIKITVLNGVNFLVELTERFSLLITCGNLRVTIVCDQFVCRHCEPNKTQCELRKMILFISPAGQKLLLSKFYC